MALRRAAEKTQRRRFCAEIYVFFILTADELPVVSYISWQIREKSFDLNRTALRSGNLTLVPVFVELSLLRRSAKAPYSYAVA